MAQPRGVRARDRFRTSSVFRHPSASTANTRSPGRCRAAAAPGNAARIVGRGVLELLRRAQKRSDATRHRHDQAASSHHRRRPVRRGARRGAADPRAPHYARLNGERRFVSEKPPVVAACDRLRKRRIQRGYQINPVPLNLNGKSRALVGLGARPPGRTDAGRVHHAAAHRPRSGCAGRKSAAAGDAMAGHRQENRPRPARDLRIFARAIPSRPDNPNPGP